MGRYVVDLDNTVDYPSGQRHRAITLKVQHKDTYPEKDLNFIDQAEFKAQAMGRVMHELQAMLEDHVKIEQIDEPDGEEFITKVELLFLKPIKNGRRKKS